MAEMAAGVLHAARQRTLAVPQDLSVIGFDDTVIAGHVGAADHGALADRVDGAFGGAQAAGRHAADDEGTKEPSLFLSKPIRRASVEAPRNSRCQSATSPRGSLMFDRTYYAPHPDMMACVSNDELRDRYLIEVTCSAQASTWRSFNYAGLPTVS